MPLAAQACAPARGMACPRGDRRGGMRPAVAECILDGFRAYAIRACHKLSKHHAALRLLTPNPFKGKVVRDCDGCHGWARNRQHPRLEGRAGGDPSKQILTTCKARSHWSKARVREALRGPMIDCARCMTHETGWKSALRGLIREVVPPKALRL